MEAVEFKGVTFNYPKTEYPALKDISFKVSKGELVLIMGASAAGKSTLLKLIKNEISPAGKLTGEVRVNGSVGYVSQNVEESIVCSRVRSELAFGLENMGLEGDEIELKCAETASYFNIEDKLDCEVSTLSGGEKQMLCLASVMIMKPDILVLDEPCSQLDYVSASRFIAMIKRLRSDFGITVIMSEHNTDELFEYANSVAFLNNSRLAYYGGQRGIIAFLKEENSPMLSAVPARFILENREYTVKNTKEQEAGDTAVSAENISFAYEKGKVILNDLSLKVYKGKINAVIGPNSSGKSTLLKVIAGVNRSLYGKVKCGSAPSMLTQNVYNLFTKDTCGEEVEFSDLTDYLEISDIKDKHPYDLSGGQAQRLALAMVLSKGSDIILLDEPTNGFDAALKIKLGELLRDLCARGKTVLLVTHDLDFAGEYCDSISFLSRGKIITTATRKSFFSSLEFYTTQVSRITRGEAVALSDLEVGYEKQ